MSIATADVGPFRGRPMRARTEWRCVLAVAGALTADSGAFVPAPYPPGSPYDVGNEFRSNTRARLNPTERRLGRGGGRYPTASTRVKGVPEWKAAQSGETRDLGFLPFPVDDVMCPGETKALHLYEARFLALFENAIRDHGGCVGGAIFIDDGVLVRVGQLCDIVAWEREEVGVSVAVRCVGRVEITDVTSVDPYIQASVREVQDGVGEDPSDEDSNNVVSSDVFSLHRQCVEIEAKMAAAGGGLGWEAREREPAEGLPPAPSTVQEATAAVSDIQEEGASEKGGGETVEVDRRETGSPDDLMSRFQRGSGELDLGQLAAASSTSSPLPGTGSVEDGNDLGDGGRSRAGNAGKSGQERGDDKQKRGLEDLLWGHETWAGDGFDVSLEEQVEAMYESLKADLRVSLEEARGGRDAYAFGAPGNPAGEDGSPRAWGGMKTIAELIASASSAAEDVDVDPSRKRDRAAGNGLDAQPEEEEEYLWGCATWDQEHTQLVSFVSLGCFDPSARLQSLMIMSTGQRLRMAREALAERLKVLVAKSALSQLGD